MACCGGKNQTRTQAIKQIAQAQVMAAVDTLLNREPSFPGFRVRLATCEQCEHATWIGRGERAAWLIVNLATIAANPHTIGDDTTPLPVQPFAEGRIMCCALCRCVCAQKARLAAAECQLGRWPSAARNTTLL